MPNKRHLHHILVVIRRVRLWQLIVLVILFGALSAYLLRQNNLGMIERRNMVKMADEKNQDLEASLRELQKYVASHMNTDMGSTGVYLDHSYQRAYDQAVQESLKSDNVAKELYEKVELECRPIFAQTSSFPAYTQCASEKLAAHGPGKDPLSEVKIPSTDLYRFNFASPILSFDAAGFSVLITLVLLLIIFGRILFVGALTLMLKYHRR